MKGLFLCCVFSLFLLSVDAQGGQVVKGRSVIYVQNGDTATLQWDFTISLNDVNSVYITYAVNPTPIIAYVNKNIQVPNVVNQFINRVSASLPTSNRGIVMILKNINIADQGEYKCAVQKSDFRTYTNITKVIVKVPPALNKDVTVKTKTERDSVSLPCIATAGNPKPINFQWLKEKGSTFEPVTGVMLHNTRYDYNITSVGREHRGVYKCKVWNIGGNDEYRITLNVYYAPVVTYLTPNRTVFERQGIEEFNCDVDGNPPNNTKYHWYRGIFSTGQEIKQSNQYIVLENGNKRLKFLKPLRSHADVYYCAGSNIHGIGNAKGTYLNVTYKPGPPVIENEKSGVFNGDEGTNVTVKCTSDANPPAYYTWHKKMRDWTGKLDFHPIEKSGSYSGELTLYNASTNDTADYKCVASNQPNENDRAKQYSDQVLVKVIIRYGPRKTNFSINGINHTRIEVKQGHQALVICESESEPPARYNIRISSGNPIQLNTNDYIGRYTIPNMSIQNEGIYECIASNEVLGREEKRQIHLVVAIPPTKLPSVDTPSDVDEGATVTIHCNAQGRPAPKVYWQKYGANITNDSVIQSSYAPKFMSQKLIPVEANLKFNGIRYTDSGSYSCIVYNSAASYNNTVKITVEFKPRITNKPQDVTVRLGDGKEASLRCEAIAYPKMITWEWYFEGRQMSETSNQFIRPLPQKTDNGEYTCRSMNSKGYGQNATARIIVEYAPTIISITENKILNVGENIILMCKADGIPKPKITWTKDRSSVEHIGEYCRIKNVQAKDKGVYSCSATNLVNSDTKSVRISVKHAPIITTVDPGQVKVGAEVGSTANLKCDASAFPTPVITWKEHGSPTILVNGIDGYQITHNSEMFGTTSTLTVAVQDKHLGKKYVCIANNSLGETNQEFQILKRGKPDPPVRMNLTDIRQPTIPVSVNITITWTPGYTGGYPVQFILLYKEESEVNFKENYIGSPQGNKYVFSNRKAGATYQFSMKAKNERGISGTLKPVSYRTKEPPKNVVTVSIAKGDDGTSVVISWIIFSNPALRRRRAVALTWDYGKVRYKREIDTEYTEILILAIPVNGSYIVRDLEGDEQYDFQFIVYDTNGNFGNPVQLPSIYPRKGPSYNDDSGLSKTDIIALSVGLGGAMLLIIIIILFIAIYRKKDKKSSNYKSHYNNGRVQVDIPVSTMRSQYSSDVVRSSYLNDEDPFAMDTSVIDDDEKTSPPPDYNDMHYTKPPNHDFPDHPNQHSTFRPDDPMPSYTSFGRIPKKQEPPHSKSMTSLNGTRATEISRRNENRYSVDALDDYPERNDEDPLLQKPKDDNRRNQRNSRGRLSSDDDLPEPPHFMRNALRSPPSDEGGINNRVPGAFGDRANRFKKPSPQPYQEASAATSPTSGRLSPAPSSVASSKPYRSDNEYIDDAEENYVGYLV